MTDQAIEAELERLKDYELKLHAFIVLRLLKSQQLQADNLMGQSSSRPMPQCSVRRAPPPKTNDQSPPKCCVQHRREKKMKTATKSSPKSSGGFCPKQLFQRQRTATTADSSLSFSKTPAAKPNRDSTQAASKPSIKLQSRCGRRTKIATKADPQSSIELLQSR